MSREVVLVAAARSAFGRRGGMFRTVDALDLGANVVRGLLDRTRLLDRTVVDDVFVGSAYADAISNSHARYVTLASGLPESVSSTSLEMQCGSAITALNYAAYKIAMGGADTIIVGGVESHSRKIVKFPTWMDSYKFIAPAALPVKFGPKDEHNLLMAQISDRMAAHWQISRQACDEYALRSQQLMEKAIQSGFTGPEVVPYVIPAARKTPEQVLLKDEYPRPATTLEGLSQLRELNQGGVTTAGNSSGVNDGASFVLLMSAEHARECGYEPYARWVFGASAGCRPDLMGIGASYASQKALKACGLKLSDIDVWECNEAFASQNLSCIKDLEKASGERIDMNRWNPNGGAIAIGHPNGASGTRIVWWAAHQLELTGGRYACVTSCCGGGQGTTVILENLRR